ncbi:MAG: rhodanese-like domain-containing protein [Luteolibacter sp.]
MHDCTNKLPDFIKITGLSGLIWLTSCTPEKPAAELNEKPHSKALKIPSTHKSSGKSTAIGLNELFQLQQSGSVLIYDVRVPYFYQIDHIPGAINWPYTDYVAQIQSRDLEIQEALASGKRVVVYCFNLGCPEARGVAHKLARRDYNVSVLSLGIDSWRTAGLPME